jgi:outer membrane lipoprotein-sorting protein
MKLLLITYIIFLSVYISGQKNEFEKIYSRYSDVKCFSTAFKQTMKLNGSGETGIVKGKLIFKNDNKFRVELNRNTIVSNGVDYWNYDENLNRVVINAVEEGNSIFNVQNLLKDFSVNYNIKETVPGRQLLLTSQNSNFSKVVIIYSDNYRIDEMELTDTMNNVIKIDLYDTKFNVDFDNNLFEFSPPQGSQIVDLR